MTGPTDPLPPTPARTATPTPVAGGATMTLIGALVAAVVAAAPAAADAPSDIAAAQTAAALENSTIAAYALVAALPAVENLPAPAGVTLTDVLTRAARHHRDHLAAFNSAAVRLGGKVQGGADQTVTSTVIEPALATVASALDAVTLVAKLELILAETYAAQVAAVSDRQLRGSLASVAGVDAQHQAVLLAIAALLGANSPDLIVFPLDPGRVPATMPSSGMPGAFLRADAARPATEGSVR